MRERAARPTAARSSPTLQPKLLKQLQSEYPRADYLATKTLHRTQSALAESFITLRGTQNKLEVLVDVLTGKAPVSDIPRGTAVVARAGQSRSRSG